jgi:hypothetical protein
LSNTLDFNKHKRFINKILKGEVNLLTGAGFSMGATVRGENICSTNQLLTKILTDILEYTEADVERIKKRKNFQQICQLAITKITENEFNNFLERTFRYTKPAEFHYLYTEIEWKNIFTLNIDDLMEKIYEEKFHELNIEIQSYNTTKQPQEYTGEKVLKYYKLHGDVLNKSEGFVFSSNQYLGKLTQKKRTYNYTKFAEYLYHDTFCFIGTNLSEVDLEVYVEEFDKGIGSPLPQEKIYYINKTIYPEDRLELERKNIVCIEETAESFIKKIIEYAKENYLNNQESGLRIKKKLDLPTRLINLGFKIEENLNVLFKQKIIDTHKPIQFYSGFEVKWIDILSKSDAILRNTEKLIEDINKNITFNLFLLLGKSGNGKTTSIKRIIYNYSTNDDYLVLSYNEKTQLTEASAKKLAQELNKIDKKIILVFDNASWAFLFLMKLYDNLQEDISISIIVSSRIPEYYREMRNLNNMPSLIYNYDETICSENARRLISKLEDKSYLGDLGGISSMDKRIKKFMQNFKKSNQDLFSTLIVSTSGDGYYKKLNEKITKIMSDKDNAHFLIVLSIFDSFASYPLSLQLYFNIFKNRIKDLKQIVSVCSDLLNHSDLADYNNLNINVRPRGSYVTNKILSVYSTHFTQEDILNISKEIIIYLSSQYNVAFNKSKNINTEMTHALLISKLYVQKFKIKDKNLFDNYYYSLSSYFDANSDFWLQYAKMEMKLKDFESSKIHLDQAMALSPNSYKIQHALGQWYMFKAITIDNYEQAKIIFQEGSKLMESQLLINDAYPVHSYIDGFMMFHKKFKFELKSNQIKHLYKIIQDALVKFNNHALLMIIWKQFYLFLEKENKTGYITVSLEDLKSMDAIDLHKSAEEQYII